jgi:hypothetical protein
VLISPSPALEREREGPAAKRWEGEGLFIRLYAAAKETIDLA